MVQIYHIFMAPRATSDLIEICAYIEKRSPQNAALTAKTILAAIYSLETFPTRFPQSRARRQEPEIIRSMPIAPFVVYYRVRERNFSVEILTIRHGAQMQPEIN